MEFTRAQSTIEEKIERSGKFLISWEHPITEALVKEGNESSEDNDGVELIGRCFLTFFTDDVLAASPRKFEGGADDDYFMIDQKSWDDYLTKINL